MYQQTGKWPLDWRLDKYRGSYENAALFTQVAGKQLVYVVGTDPDDRVNQISDVAQWQCTIKNQTFVGTHLHKQILRHQTMYPYVRFVFTKREEVCQTIWNMVSK